MAQTVEIQTMAYFEEGYQRERQCKYNELEMGAVAVEVNGQSLMASGPVRGNALEKGMVVLGRCGDTYNIYEILGISDKTEKYGTGGVAFDTVKETFAAAGVKSLTALEAVEGSGEEYGHGYYLWLRDLGSVPEGIDRKGPWSYVYNGRWSLGSGGNAVSWTRLRSVEEVAHSRKVKAAANEVQSMKQKVEMKRKRIARLQAELEADEAELETMQTTLRELKTKA